MMPIKHRSYTFALVSLIVLLSYSNRVAAEIVASNLDSPYQIGMSISADPGTTKYIVAQSFTTGAFNYRLESVTLALQSSDVGSAELRLRTNRAFDNTPDGLAEYLGSKTILGASDGLATYQAGQFGNAAMLAPNTTYWLTLGESFSTGDLVWTGTFASSAPSPAGWQIANQAMYRINNGLDWIQYETGQPNESVRFQINATAVPEPSAVWMVVSSVCGLLVYRRRVLVPNNFRAIAS